MAISKIIYKANASATPETWMDATSATAVAADITAPKTAMLANGVVTTGTGTGGGGDAPTPTDGNTHVWIDIPQNVPDAACIFKVSFTVQADSSYSIDWGDGTDPETYNEDRSASLTRTHTYNTSGKYEIIIRAISGSLSMGVYNQYNIFCGPVSSYYPDGYARRSWIKRVHIGTGWSSFGQYSFNSCPALTVVSFSGVDGLGFGNYMFSSCTSLAKIVLPTGLQNIGTNVFNGCSALSGSVVIPEEVTSIGAYAFSSCYNVSEYHLMSTTPPELANTNAFNGIMTGTVIYVPCSADHSILNAYKTATNWSTYASYMQEEPQ